MLEQINIHDAKTQLSKLLKKVQSGEEVVIAKSGKPIARLVPFCNKPIKRISGTAKGKVFIADDFNEPLPKELLEDFEI